MSQYHFQRGDIVKITMSGSPCYLAIVEGKGGSSNRFKTKVLKRLDEKYIDKVGTVLYCDANKLELFHSPEPKQGFNTGDEVELLSCSGKEAAVVFVGVVQEQFHGYSRVKITKAHNPAFKEGNIDWYNNAMRLTETTKEVETPRQSKKQVQEAKKPRAIFQIFRYFAVSIVVSAITEALVLAILCPFAGPIWRQDKIRVRWNDCLITYHNVGNFYDFSGTKEGQTKTTGLQIPVNRLTACYDLQPNEAPYAISLIKRNESEPIWMDLHLPQGQGLLVGQTK